MHFIVVLGSTFSTVSFYFKIYLWQNNIEYQDVDGIYTAVMQYTFEGANEMPPGLYSIAVSIFFQILQ